MLSGEDREHRKKQIDTGNAAFCNQHASSEPPIQRIASIVSTLHTLGFGVYFALKENGEPCAWSATLIQVA